MKKKAIITGITGQDGSYLSEFLLDKGYEVHGTVRRSSSINTTRIDDLISKHKSTNRLKLHYSDLLDSSSLSSLTLFVISIEASEHMSPAIFEPMPYI